MNKEIIVIVQEVALVAVEIEMIKYVTSEDRKTILDAARAHLKKGRDAL